jgi:ubiquinone/menaquinone biosynthesis C-methylase UbiE
MNSDPARPEQTVGADATERTLTVEEARAFYDRLGSRQDWQRFFEDPAVDVMLNRGDFAYAKSVLEFGCGTGRLADRLLSDFLAADCRYLGIDASDTMVNLARDRLRPWANRATIRRSNGSCALTETDAGFDRVVSTYVLDLLSRDQIHQFISECRRVLTIEGLLCLVSLSHGQGEPGRLISSIWAQLHSLSPWIVGGCRPIDLTEFLLPSVWQIRHVELIRTFGITSQVVLASRR